MQIDTLALLKNSCEKNLFHHKVLLLSCSSHYPLFHHNRIFCYIFLVQKVTRLTSNDHVTCKNTYKHIMFHVCSAVYLKIPITIQDNYHSKV